MACFIVPAAEAVVVGVVKKVAESKEPHKEASEATHEATPFTGKLVWLFKLLIG